MNDGRQILVTLLTYMAGLVKSGSNREAEKNAFSLAIASRFLRLRSRIGTPGVFAIPEEGKG